MSGARGERRLDGFERPRATEAAGGRLDAHLFGRRGGLEFDLTVSLEPGEVLAVLGPNGAGKSTLLECLAGLLVPAGGSIVLDGRELFRANGTAGVGADVQAGEGAGGPAPTSVLGRTRERGSHGEPQGHAVRVRGHRSVPTARRGIGLLGQEPRLFPHLSARDNVAFGPAYGRHGERMSRGRARAQAEAWLERVGLAGLGDRRPRQLSGGQQQRVAIARALAARPAVLLLDEPLASLDVEVAPGIRRLLREQLRATGTSAVLVSHEVLDAVAIADRVAVIDRGRIVETGPTAAALAAPRTPFLAALAGVNLVVGVTAQGRVVAGEHAFAGVGSDVASGAGSDAVWESGARGGRGLAGSPPDLRARETPRVTEDSDGASRRANSVAETSGAAERPGSAAAPARPEAGRSIELGDGAMSRAADPPLVDGRRAAAVFRPSSVIVATSRPEHTSLRNIWRDRIVAIEPAPGGARLRFAAPALTAEVTAAALADLGLREGDDVWLAVKASEVGLHALD